MPDISALAKYPCAACGAQAEWNPAKQLLVCPFCGTSAPFKIDEATGAIEELDLAKALRELPDEAARLDGREADGPVPELQGRHGLRPRARRPELRLLRLARARRLQGDQGAHPAAKPAAVQGDPGPGPRADPQAGTRANGWRRTRSRHRALVDRVHGLYIPYWTFDAQSRLPVGCGCRPLLLHDRDRPGERTHRDAAGPPRALGAGIRRGRSTSSTTSRCPARRGSRCRC